MLTLGQWRGLQAVSTPRGVFTILALDHRDSLRALLNPGAPGSVKPADLVEFKHQAVSALAPAGSAALLDPVFGLSQCVVSGALPGQAGLIVALEQTGHQGSPTARLTELLEGWSVEKIKRTGSDGVELLVHYHPDASTASQQEALVKRVADECQRYDIALYLELLPYPIDPADKELKPAEREQVVVESANRLSDLGITVLLTEFPVDCAAVPEEAKWLPVCRELTQASSVPWVLLSAAAPYDLFKRQVKVAATAGASGVVVGRAVWQEAASLTGQARVDFLQGEGLRRVQELGDAAATNARPWTEVFQSQTPSASEHWYKLY